MPLDLGDHQGRRAELDDRRDIVATPRRVEGVDADHQLLAAGVRRRRRPSAAIRSRSPARPACGPVARSPRGRARACRPRSPARWRGTARCRRARSAPSADAAVRGDGSRQDRSQQERQRRERLGGVDELDRLGRDPQPAVDPPDPVCGPPGPDAQLVRRLRRQLVEHEVRPGGDRAVVVVASSRSRGWRSRGASATAGSARSAHR